MSNLIRFKENANPAKHNLGLEKEGRSKFPGCVDIIQPARGIDMRWKTGMDEDAMSVNAITDVTLREETKAKLKKEREELQQMTGLDLSAMSKFWESFFIEINPNQPLNLLNPMDRIKYNVVLVSDAVAPNLRKAYEAEYTGAKYYISKENEDVTEKLSKKKRYNLAVSKLEELIKVPDQAILIGKYLDLSVSNTTPQDNIYDAFQTYLDSDDKTDSIDKFMSALNRTPEELSIKLIYQDAIKFNVIRMRDNLYQRGNITMGKTPNQVVDFLSDFKNSSELLSIQEEIEMKRKFG